ncbi:MAG: hypothetical protein J7604_00905 [Sporocytophaga sp.]|uniref:hypothetical protein n=1 Tax=Sporocytophaga sp. TaxID=2231183 RepID=UPI001B0E1AFE|nr:hypothetical protein [Sporocytophaga sp.]MBO9698730.1 hypothetical protein [Sporocytophaga sp.]
MKRLIFCSLIFIHLSCNKSPEEQKAKMLEDKLQNAADLEKAKADSLDLAAKNLKKEADSVRDVAKELKDSSKNIRK